MNILGEGFPPEIINQVTRRQKVYGSGYDPNSFRTPDNLVYLNANTAWCKLVSSTYIDNIDLINNESVKNLRLGGDELARQFILFNGTTAGENQRPGIDINNIGINSPLAFNSAYGIGGTEFGINPMMGIQSAVINHKNRGSIRTATVNIKAWNKIQFEIIDVLYLRLGFSVLLEWGHSMYYTSPDPDYSEFVSNPVNSSLANEFLDGTSNYKEFLNKIQNKRLETFGNYDAMFAKVTNFHWSFKPDGSYDIVLNLVSVGDVVESFKIKGNAALSIKTNNSATPNTPTVEEELAKYAQSSELADYLYKCITTLKSPKNSNQSCFLYNTSVNTDWNTYWDSNGTFASSSNGSGTKDICIIIPSGGTLGTYSEEVIKTGPPPVPRQLTQVEQDTVLALQGFTKNSSGNLTLSNRPVPVDQWPAPLREWKRSKDAYAAFAASQSAPSSTPNLKFTPEQREINEGKFISKNSYFIRLGNLLQFIQEGIMYKIASSDSNASDVPVLNFDYDIETNLMHSPPNMMGYDPRLAMVRTNMRFKGGNEDIIPNRTYFDQTNGSVTQFAENFYTLSTTPELGKIMNIYINFQFILNKLKELENKDTNEVLLIDFLKGILAGVNNSFGGFSKLDVFIDELTNTLKIIDQNPLPSVNDAINYVNSFGNTLSKDLAFFDLYGYNTDTDPNTPTTAGFIEEFNFTTELTPEFSIMITTAATSNGNVVGENNTALSKLNKGLSDKYKKVINGGGASQQTVNYNSQDAKQVLQTNYNTALTEFQDFAKGFKTYIDNLYAGNYINDEIDSYKDSITMYFKLWKKFMKAAQEYYNYDSANPSKSNSTQFQPGTGFIPFNLSLKMKGLSGMKLGSRFLIDTSYLPSNYPDTVDFLIKNLSHEIKDNKWITSLESYCIAKGPDGYTTPNDGQTPVPPVPTTGDGASNVTPGNRSNCAIKNIPSTPKPISPNSVITYFKAKKYSKAAIAGILANIKAESGFNMNAFNPAGGGCGAYGLVQWRGDRQTGLYNYSKALSQPIDAFYVQLGYLYQEIESSSVRRIKNLNDPRETAYIVASEFERFTNSSDRNNPEVIKRQNFASQFISQIS